MFKKQLAQRYSTILLVSALTTSSVAETVEVDQPRQTITLESDLSPIAATYKDLFNAIEKARSIIAKANADLPNDYTHENLTLRDNQFSIAFSEDFRFDAFAGAPEVTYDAYYHYYKMMGAPISDVSIRLTDGYRKMSVSGTDPEQVKSLYLVLLEDLNKHTTTLGGDGWRLWGAFFLWMTISILFVSGVYLLDQRLIGSLSCWIMVAFLCLLLFLPAWNVWLPGTAIYPDSASWIVRHSAGITFVGSAVTVVAFVLMIIGLLRNSFRPAIAVENNSSEDEGKTSPRKRDKKTQKHL